MIIIYNVVASGGDWEDAYRHTVASFTSEEDAQRYLEMHCTLEGEDMQAKHGEDGNNYLWWRNKDRPEWYEIETWTIECECVYESLKECLEDV